MQDFRKLKVWEKAHVLTLSVYRVTRSFPGSESRSLVPQARRAAISIGANLAEACGRRGERERRQFFSIAMGSACELEYEMVLARDLAYLDQPAFESLHLEIVEVKRMLAGILRRIR